MIIILYYSSIIFLNSLAKASEKGDSNHNWIEDNGYHTNYWDSLQYSYIFLQYEEEVYDDCTHSDCNPDPVT